MMGGETPRGSLNRQGRLFYLRQRYRIPRPPDVVAFWRRYSAQVASARFSRETDLCSVAVLMAAQNKAQVDDFRGHSRQIESNRHRELHKDRLFNGTVRRGTAGTGNYASDSSGSHVSEAKFLGRIAKRTVLSDSALSVVIPILEDIFY